MEMLCNEPGKIMLEAQRDSRRQRHIAALKEAQKFIDQFYDNFAERKNEIRERSRVFTMASDAEIADLAASLTDENLLANEITFVNGVWDKIQQHRTARRTDTDRLREDFDKLKEFQAKGSTGFLTKLREDLLYISFLLEPEINELMVQYMDDNEKKYAAEHEECDAYWSEVTHTDKEKFEKHYDDWKAAVARFQQLKQEDAITTFLDKMNGVVFVNPKSRQEIFEEMREEQMNLFNQRSSIINELNMTRPTALNANVVNSLEEKLR